MTVAHIYYDGEIMSNDPGAKGCYDIKEVCFLFLFNFSIFIKGTLKFPPNDCYADQSGCAGQTLSVNGNQFNFKHCLHLE